MDCSKPSGFNGFIPLFSGNSFQPLMASAGKMHETEGSFQPFEVRKNACDAKGLYLEARSVLGS